MPRGPRLDTTGALHHVMVRGINREGIFLGDPDRRDFLQRLEDVSRTTGLQVLAWSLLPNHLHLLVRTGARPLSTAMRKLLTGYATAFNLRHRRTGHLFQNRFKSIMVEEEPYLLELVRYIHLNPIRAGILETMEALDRYPWTGHSAIMGRFPRPWQAVNQVLHFFAGRTRAARRSCRAFVAEGISRGHRPELGGGGLIRSAGGLEAVEALRRGREAWMADERILGGSDFVMQVMRETMEKTSIRPARPKDVLPQLIKRVADYHGLSIAACCHGSRSRQVVAARNEICFLATTELGLPATDVARALHVSPQSAGRGVERTRHLSERERGQLVRLLKQIL